jgi:CRP/FNR family cyclic AMP-dependent transcriptional regulator
MSGSGAREKMISVLQKILESEDFPEGYAWCSRTFAAQEVIVREGEQGGYLYLVVAGDLRVTGQVDIDEARKMHPGICDLGPGDVFGELCLFDKQPRSATVEGLNPGQLIEIDANRLNQWLDRHPALGLKTLREFYGELISRLRKTNQRVESLLAWGLRAHGIDKHF